MQGNLTYFQVFQESLDIQAPLGTIPITIGSDVLEASIREDRIMVLCRERERSICH